jgi:hypothetical protein
MDLSFRSDCSTAQAQGRLRPDRLRLPAANSNRLLSGWNQPPLAICARRHATEKFGLTVGISAGGSKDDQLLYADDAAPAFVEAFFDVDNAETDTR